MVQTASAYEEVLLRRRVVSHEQLADARDYLEKHGGRLKEAIVLLGYATDELVTQALAAACVLEFVNLEGVTIPQAIIELIPESVVRENVVLPFRQENRVLTVVVSDPDDADLVAKLHFILNKKIRLVLATRQQIIEAINRHYGGTVQESVDSMLCEFTDTAIDFSSSDAGSLDDESQGRETRPMPRDKDTQFPEDVDLNVKRDESASPAEEDLDLEDSDFDLALCDEGPPSVAARAPLVGTAPRSKGGMSWGMGPTHASIVERQATVRYYDRMNPQRMFPLLVVLSKKAIQEVVKKHVSQSQSKKFEVALASAVEVEPVLPGCQCYPPKAEVAVQERDVQTTFWVVPLVLGEVMHARVLVRQNGIVLAEVPLEMKVVRQGLAMLMGCLSFALPVGLMVTKHFGIDFESQMRDGGLYAQAAGWVQQTFSPEGLAALLLTATALTYLWFRPRRRDVFWEIEPARHDPRRPQPRTATRPPESQAKTSQAELFQQAERSMRWQRFDVALRFYEQGLALAGPSTAPANTGVYSSASLAAHFSGQTKRAFEILKLAEARLGTAGMKATMWYNLGCFATRLGQLADAVVYLNRAIDAGYADPEKYQTDPDLEPLRWRADFKRLLAGIEAGQSCCQG